MSKLGWLLLLLGATAWGTEARLPDWPVQTGAGDKLQLYDRLGESPVTLLAIVASESQDNGQEQQRALLNTHQQLAAAIDDLPPVKHLTLIAGAPRLVHGFIRRGLAGEYAEPVDDEDILLAFLSDYDDYTDATGLPVDERATWLLVDGQGVIQWVLRQEGDNMVEPLRQKLSQR